MGGYRLPRITISFPRTTKREKPQEDKERNPLKDDYNAVFERLRGLTSRRRRR